MDKMQEIKNKLNALSCIYLDSRNEFEQRQESLIQSFHLSKNEKRLVFFGIIEHDNKSLQKYCDILNIDELLKNLSAVKNKLFLDGNMLIIDLLLECEISISGYDLKAFKNFPNEHEMQIYNLILGLGGYEHIHIIENKILKEVPARNYLINFPEIIELVDAWLQSNEIFDVTD